MTGVVRRRCRLGNDKRLWYGQENWREPQQLQWQSRREREWPFLQLTRLSNRNTQKIHKIVTDQRITVALLSLTFLMLRSSLFRFTTTTCSFPNRRHRHFTNPMHRQDHRLCHFPHEHVTTPTKSIATRNLICQDNMLYKRQQNCHEKQAEEDNNVIQPLVWWAMTWITSFIGVIRSFWEAALLLLLSCDW